MSWSISAASPAARSSPTSATAPGSPAGRSTSRIGLTPGAGRPRDGDRGGGRASSPATPLGHLADRIGPRESTRRLLRAQGGRDARSTSRSTASRGCWSPRAWSTRPHARRRQRRAHRRAGGGPGSPRSRACGSSTTRARARRGARRRRDRARRGLSRRADRLQRAHYVAYAALVMQRPARGARVQRARADRGRATRRTSRSPPSTGVLALCWGMLSCGAAAVDGAATRDAPRELAAAIVVDQRGRHRGAADPRASCARPASAPPEDRDRSRRAAGPRLRTVRAHRGRTPVMLARRLRPSGGRAAVRRRLLGPLDPAHAGRSRPASTRACSRPASRPRWWSAPGADDDARRGLGSSPAGSCSRRSSCSPRHRAAVTRRALCSGGRRR